MDTENELAQMLYDYYLDALSQESPNTMACRKELMTILRPLPFKENDRIQRAVNELCAEYERSGFLSGVHLGAGLIFMLFK